MQTELHMAGCVDRHPPEQRFLPANLGVGRQRGHVEHVRHPELLHAHRAVGPRVAIGNAPGGFGGFELQAAADPAERRAVVVMDELDVTHVERVFQILKIVASPVIRIHLDETGRMIELRIARKLRRGAGTEIGEDQTEVIARRIGADRDFSAKCRAFGGLLETCAVGAEAPAVIEAANRLAVDPAGRELRAAMRTARIDQDRCAGRAAIEREIRFHDAQRRGGAGREIGAVKHRLPEAAQVAAFRRVCSHRHRRR
jgi:hypothetical protein